ncbi:MAG: hypothetical protein PHY34_01200 [Patescibacteria group bacterium]|nr:hypothetical protein [Patescibacteria group bacterium]MDD5715165.1 hypothetical protein [Patescibacteria group bacterium]
MTRFLFMLAMSFVIFTGVYLGGSNALEAFFANVHPEMYDRSVIIIDGKVVHHSWDVSSNCMIAELNQVPITDVQ